MILCVGWHVYRWTIVSVKLYYENPTKRIGLAQSGLHHHEHYVACSRHDIADKIVELALNNNSSLTIKRICYIIMDLSIIVLRRYDLLVH
jgi:hypothetical protein